MKKLLLLVMIGCGFSLLSFSQNGNVNESENESVSVQSAKPTFRIQVRNWGAEGRIEAKSLDGPLPSNISIDGCAKTLMDCGMETGPEEYVDCFNFSISAGSSESSTCLNYMCGNPQQIVSFYHINLSKTSDEYANYVLIY